MRRVTRHNPIKVKIKKSLLEKFRREAKRSFADNPQTESYGLLLGCVEKDLRYVINEILIPPDDKVKKYDWESPGFELSQAVYCPDSALAEVKKYAEKKNLIVLGDIHSHNSDVGTPSIDDLHNSWDLLHYSDGVPPIFAVTGVWEHEGKIHTRTRFFPAMLRIKQEIV